MQTLPAGARYILVHYFRLYSVQCTVYTARCAFQNTAQTQCTGRARTSCVKIMFANAAQSQMFWGNLAGRARTLCENNVCKLPVTELSSNLLLQSSRLLSPSHPDHCPRHLWKVGGD